MKIISWNVNSIRARMEAFLKVLYIYNPDIILLQETRVSDDSFPYSMFEDVEYNIEIFGQKGRNGVAIFSKYPIEDVKHSFSEEARYIEAFIKGAFFASVYVPNGQEINTNPYFYKLEFLKRLKDKFLEYKNEIFIAGGDYNVAPFSSDTHYGENYKGLCCSDAERAAIKEIREVNFFDSLKDKGFTWWDYRSQALKKDKGYRIDQIYLSCKAYDLFLKGEVLRDVRNFPRPSDHAPLFCEIKL